MDFIQGFGAIVLLYILILVCLHMAWIVSNQIIWVFCMLLQAWEEKKHEILSEKS